jgi:hypothetical protein
MIVLNDLLLVYDVYIHVGCVYGVDVIDVIDTVV